MFVHTGNYIEHESVDALRSTYYTFTPIPLIDGTFYKMDDELASMLVDSHRDLGFLDGITSIIDDRESIAKLVLYKESCYSKMIDYPDSDIRSFLVEQCESEGNRDIHNIVTAYRYAVETAPGKLGFNSLHNYALDGNNPMRKTSIRTTPLFLAKSTTNYRQYNPTAPDEITRALADINSYIESNPSDVLIKAAMSNYQLEMIYPYKCYNGIIARIFLYHILSNAKLNGTRFLSLSTSLHRHKSEYFDKLWATQKNGNYPVWIRFIIGIIMEAAQQGIEFARYYSEQTRHEEERIIAHHQGRADNTLNIYRFYRKNVASSIRRASEQLQLSFPTISRSVRILKDLGILTQASEGARNRIFVHKGLWRHLSAE